MTAFQRLSPTDLSALARELQSQYDAFKAKGLKLDMTRGKPSNEQLDLANGLLTNLAESDYTAKDGTDTRNYGGLDGLPEMKAIFAAMTEATPANVIVGGNSSLQLMFDTIVRGLLYGMPDGNGPWRNGPVKFICPTPGYDRHFSVLEHNGIEMIPVDLLDDGPDMARVRELVESDASIKGMWCVPKYSNPTGITYGAQTVRALASMKTAAPDFRLFWDNAYAVHDLHAETDPLENIFEACTAASHPNRAIVFVSTSKISFAGAGVAAMASSAANIADAKRHATIQTIGPDKINQLRHVRFYEDFDGVRRHMQKHAAILRPKFEAVARVFEALLGGKGIAEWTHPRGGYFVSLDTLDGCAKAVVKMADEAGVKLTAAGATFPHGKDPRDRNIRVAPTMPPASQVETAMEIVALCVQLVSIKKLTGIAR